MLSHLWFMPHRLCITHGRRLFIINQRLRITAITALERISDTTMDRDTVMIIGIIAAGVGMTGID